MALCPSCRKSISCFSPFRNWLSYRCNVCHVKLVPTHKSQIINYSLIVLMVGLVLSVRPFMMRKLHMSLPDYSLTESFLWFSLGALSMVFADNVWWRYIAKLEKKADEKTDLPAAKA